MKKWMLVAAILPLAAACSNEGDARRLNSTGAGGEGAATADGGMGGDAAGDFDGDGHASLEDGGDDCDDGDETIFPGAPDTVGDDIDQDCDGADGVDGDGDGHASEASGGLDCNDDSDLIHPGASDDGELGDQVVFNTDNSTQSTSIAVDDDGFVHIAFGYRYNDGSLVQVAPRHLTNKSGDWVETVVDGATGSGLSISVATHGDEVHTTYTGGLRYGVLGAGSTEWDQETLRAGFGGRVRIDGSGRPHLGWADYVADEVGHAVLDGGTWSFTTIPIGDFDGVDLALAPQSDVPSLAWLDSGGVYVASADNGWSPELVHQGDADHRVAATFDPAGNLHVLFSEGGYSDNEIFHATKSTSGWEVEKLLDLVSTPEALDARFDAEGNLHAIVAMSHYGSHLSYLTKPAGGTWSTHSLFENDTDRGHYPSFTITADGTIHIAYLHFSAVFYASIAAANGIDDDCDGAVW